MMMVRDDVRIWGTTVSFVRDGMHRVLGLTFKSQCHSKCRALALPTDLDGLCFEQACQNVSFSSNDRDDSRMWWTCFCFYSESRSLWSIHCYTNENWKRKESNRHHMFSYRWLLRIELSLDLSNLLLFGCLQLQVDSQCMIVKFKVFFVLILVLFILHHLGQISLKANRVLNRFSLWPYQGACLLFSGYALACAYLSWLRPRRGFDCVKGH